MILAVIRGDIPVRVPAAVHHWLHYHIKGYMGGEYKLKAFIATGLDAIVHPPRTLR